MRWPLANLCYAAICLVVGGLVGAIGVANDNALAGVGGLIVIVGVLYLLAALWNFATVLTSPPEESDD